MFESCIRYRVRTLVRDDVTLPVVVLLLGLHFLASARIHDTNLATLF
jgi:hypothetical protein